jgi:hypothetical protein
LKEVTAQTGWQNFQAADFQRLKNQFGVTWVILSRTRDPKDDDALGMTCLYQNRDFQVCRLY